MPCVIQTSFSLMIALNMACVTQVLEEACTYNEARVAYQSGNLVRGQALMRMAVRDGDQRAVEFFKLLTDTQKVPTSTGKIELAQPSELYSFAVFSKN